MVTSLKACPLWGVPVLKVAPRFWGTPNRGHNCDELAIWMLRSGIAFANWGLPGGGGPGANPQNPALALRPRRPGLFVTDGGVLAYSQLFFLQGLEVS